MSSIIELFCVVFGLVNELSDSTAAKNLSVFTRFLNIFLKEIDVLKAKTLKNFASGGSFLSLRKKSLRKNVSKRDVSGFSKFLQRFGHSIQNGKWNTTTLTGRYQSWHVTVTPITQHRHVRVTEDISDKLIKNH